MILLMQCVAEAVVAKGARGLAEFVPGGPYLFDVADDALRRLRLHRHERALSDLRVAAAATFEEARSAAGRVVGEAAPDVPAADRLALELYLSQIPAAVRRTLRRPDDPAGRTVPAGLALGSPDDLLRLLPPQVPGHRPGDPVPGRAGWTLIEPLGAGGFGEVWRAGHDFIPDLRAVKFCTDPVARQRLLAHEGKLVARVMREGRHPNVVPLADAFLEGDAPWLGYEYVGGGDLSGLILGWQSLPVAERARRVAEALRVLADTVGHFHRLAPPIVHRDLKPSNIMVAADGALRVTDFGIGGVGAGLAGGTRAGVTAYTRAVSLLAGAYTPLYASPQQQRGDKPDPRDDVHALGVIAFQAVTGRLDQAPGPHFDRDLKALGVPAPLVRLIGDCVDPDPAGRPANGDALAARLPRPAAAPTPPPPRPAPTPQPSSGSQESKIGCVAALFLFVLVALAYFITLPTGGNTGTKATYPANPSSINSFEYDKLGSKSDYMKGMGNKTAGPVPR